jgi:riboflavin biosynthesis pyrimidine reductase
VKVVSNTAVSLDGRINTANAASRSSAARATTRG